ncbi:hypothetical protein F5880DRAFT_1510074 [Lentinula raphanica]|nr:hypothetical protein F5880DRAFT_1510074 [Lentinula raphanica]
MFLFRLSSLRPLVASMFLLLIIVSSLAVPIPSPGDGGRHALRDYVFQFHRQIRVGGSNRSVSYDIRPIGPQEILTWTLVLLGPSHSGFFGFRTEQTESGQWDAVRREKSLNGAKVYPAQNSPPFVVGTARMSQDTMIRFLEEVSSRIKQDKYNELANVPFQYYSLSTAGQFLEKFSKRKGEDLAYEFFFELWAQEYIDPTLEQPEWGSGAGSVISRDQDHYEYTKLTQIRVEEKKGKEGLVESQRSAQLVAQTALKKAMSP